MKNNKSRKILLALMVTLCVFGFKPTHIKAQSPSVNITIGVYAENQTLFKGTIQVTPCDESPSNPTKTLNAMCAIDQLATAQNWTVQKGYYDFGTTLDAINSYAPDFANRKFWGYLSNKEPGLSALNKYILKEGENLEFTYNTNLIKLTAGDEKTPGQTLNLTASFFDMNAWSRIDLTDAIFVIDNIEHISANGKYSLLLEANKTYSIHVKKNGFIDSNLLTVVTGDGDGGEIPDEGNNNFNVTLAVEFLKNKLEYGGLGEMIDDWGALALSTQKNDNEIQNLAKNLANKELENINFVTDIERKIMARLSLNIKPWEGQKDLVKDMLAYFDGKQFGSKDLVNDDAFALIVLNSVGFTKIEPEVSNTINEILSFQKEDGSFDSVDLTSASIQALAPFKEDQKIKTALEKAKTNLKSKQKEDGGFGNLFASTWAIQAIKALGENPQSWTVSGKNPIDYLISLQKTDGGMDYDGEENRAWATAYAIPAFLQKTWTEMTKVTDKYPEVIKREQGRTPATPPVIVGSLNNSQSNFPVNQQIFLSISTTSTWSTSVPLTLKAELTGLDKKPLTNARIIWSFGDGTTKEGYNVSHTWQFPGEYMVVAEASSGIYNASSRQKIFLSKADVAISKFNKGSDGFIELKNYASNDLDLSFFILKTNDKQFILPKNTIIPASSSIVIPNTTTSIYDGEPMYLSYPNGSQHFVFNTPKVIPSIASKINTSNMPASVTKIKNDDPVEIIEPSNTEKILEFFNSLFRKILNKKSA